MMSFLPGCEPDILHMQLVSNETRGQSIRHEVHAIENSGEYSYSEDTGKPMIAKVAEEMLETPGGTMSFFVKPVACHLFDAGGDARSYLADVPTPEKSEGDSAISAELTEQPS